MSLWQHLADAYHAYEGTLSKLYPLSTTSITDKEKIIIVRINGEGQLIPPPRIVKALNGDLHSYSIPVTEDSLGRTSKAVRPHPLFDQYEYLKGVGEKFEKYIANLQEYSCISKEFMAVYKYISERTLEKDIENLKPKDKTFVLFEVEYPGEINTCLWENSALMKAWHDYYVRGKKRSASEVESVENEIAEKLDQIYKLKAAVKKEKNRDVVKHLKEQIVILEADEKQARKRWSEMEKLNYSRNCLDMISGKYSVEANAHPKKLYNVESNAKLISANDDSNYTFRGKFSSWREAFSVGYESSQRAHQFLRYIINDRGILCGSQIIVSFTDRDMSKEAIRLPAPPVRDGDLPWGYLGSMGNSSEAIHKPSLKNSGNDFAVSLRNALHGYKVDKILAPGFHSKTFVLVLDAATQGRLSVSFYREMPRSEYLEKMIAWHEQCRWKLKVQVKNESSDESEYCEYIGAPSVDSIIATVFGSPRSVKDEGYTILQKKVREVLLRCIFDNSPFPENYVRQAVQRASRPYSIARCGSEFVRSAYFRNLSVSCAIINKTEIDKGKDAYAMSVENSRVDRDYLFGRLLAAADELESYALLRKRIQRDETAAIRYMQLFSQRPFSTWKTIHESLVPYMQFVRGCFAEKDLQLIHTLFKPGDFENDAPLTGAYLIGYYCEHARIKEMIDAAKSKTEEKE